MKKIRFVSLLLAFILAFSGCGSPAQTPETPEESSLSPVTTDDIRSAIDTLLTRDYIVGFLWYCDGLAAAGELTEEEYYPVSDESGYASIDDLKKLVDVTYTAETASILMNTVDSMERPLFMQQEDKLYKSAHPVLSRYFWDYDAESVEILSQEGDTVSFAVTMTNLHTGEATPVTLTMQRVQGVWGLTQNSILTAEEGLTAPSGVSETRAVAERFLTALTENDIAAIAKCADETEGSYSSWKGMSIGSAELTETLEEYDGYGRYRVHMQVADGRDAFSEGSENYLLIVSDNEGTTAVCYFEPESRVAYNVASPRDDAACAMTDIFLNAESYVRFKGTFWLDSSTATNFVLSMLYYENPAEIYSAEQVIEAAKRYLGYKDFTPEESYLSEEGYILPGGKEALGFYLIWPSQTDDNGNITVEVEHFSDRLNTRRSAAYLFTYKTNTDGTLCLISIT